MAAECLEDQLMRGAIKEPVHQVADEPFFGLIRRGACLVNVPALAFLTNDEAGRDDLARFRDFLRRIKKDIPDLESKVQIKTAARDSTSDVEMYIGRRAGQSIGILEIPQAPLGEGHGAPNYYLLIHDDQVIEHYLRKHFDRIWETATPVATFVPDSENSSTQLLPETAG